MSQQTVVLVTGSKAGIGRGLLASYATRPNTTAIAAIRGGNSSPIAKELLALPTGSGSEIIVVEYDASSQTSAKDAVAELTSKHSIDHLDVAIANAGILNGGALVKDVAADDIVSHFTVNTLGPILLYQATTALLNKSKQEPKFIIVSSALGSNTLIDSFPMPLISYSMSKAAVNFAAGKISREEERVVVIPVQPGWVQTAMGGKAAEIVGMDPKDVPITLTDSVTGLLKLFDAADKKTYSGKFWDQNLDEVAW